MFITGRGDPKHGHEFISPRQSPPSLQGKKALAFDFVEEATHA
jgi:hypothetical protein